MRLPIVASVAALLALPASAAAVTLTITVTSPAATSVTCGSTGSYTLTSPVPVGTVICPLTVQPGGWTGAFALAQSGPQSSAFAISGSNLVVGASPLTQAGAYSLSITATP